MKKNIYDYLTNILFEIELDSAESDIQLILKNKLLELELITESTTFSTRYIPNFNKANLSPVIEFMDNLGNIYLIDPSEHLNIEIMRFQNSKGLGPYHDKELGTMLHDVRYGYDPERQPIPANDDFSALAERLINQGIGNFGFLNEDQAFRWFSPKQIDLMSQYGYFLVKINVSRAFLGKNQVLFIP